MKSKLKSQYLKIQVMNPNNTEFEIACGVATKMLSFETAIELFSKQSGGRKKEPVGYRITNNGIEVIYE